MIRGGIKEDRKDIDTKNADVASRRGDSTVTRKVPNRGVQTQKIRKEKRTIQKIK